MAERKLKIALASSLPNMPASASIFLDGIALQENITVTNQLGDPLLLEYTFEANTSHLLKITFNNDYYSESENLDLNLVVEYVALSNADLTFTEGVYLTQEPHYAWGPGEPLELNFTVN